MSRAFVLLNCTLGSEKSIISKLKTLDNVKEVHGTLGMYDIILKIESESDEITKNTITDNIRKIPNIHSTMTLTRSEGSELFIPNPDKLTGSILGQNSSQAYVVIHCDQGEEYGILRKLSHVPEVKEADVVFGFYDVICKIETSSHNELEQIITKNIRSLDHMRTTMTLNVIVEQD